MLGHLLGLKVANSPHLHELLAATLLLEERQPGKLSLRMMPFYSSLFLDKSNPPEIPSRFIFVAVRSSRLPAEELANPIVRSLVVQLLNSVIQPAQRLTPALYPEITSRLSSLNSNAANITQARLAAEERIERASDRVEQLVSEANSASDENLKKHFFFLAARLAKERGQLSKAVDLAMKVATDPERQKNETRPSWLNTFLLEIVSLAIKTKSLPDATYAISQMTQPLEKAKAFRLLGEYYGEKGDQVNAKNAFTQSAKQLKSVNNGNEIVRLSLLLAESVLKYEPGDADEVFRESVKAINDLSSSKKDQEQMYLNLLPIAEDLIRSFRLLATRESETAASLAGEIKLSELRVSALSGVFSSH
jgi:hypothetical protein